MTYTNIEEIPGDVVASILGGRLCCKYFLQVQEAGDLIMGYPTFTHMYASEEFNNTLKRRLETLYIQRYNPDWVHPETPATPDQKQ